MNMLLEKLNQPEVLEEAYHRSPQEFEAQLKEAIEQNGASETLRVWKARLSYNPSSAIQKISIVQLITLCLITGFIVKIPTVFSIDSEWYQPRFIPLIIISALIIYFLKTTTSSKKIQKKIIAGMIISIVYIAGLPDSVGSASITMALVHLPLFSLAILAVSFMSDNWGRVESRLNFIRYVGEMGVYTVLILLGEFVLAIITVSLFEVTGLNIDDWYADILLVGLVSAPLVATYLFDSIQNRQSKFAPMLSNVFSPLFLITVLTYLGAIIYQGKSPFTDRDFLITVNGILLVILAVTIFSISGKKKIIKIQASDYINISLVSATLTVNIIALSAIIFRWSEYGMTVNRIVVTGANILIFIHLVLLLKQYTHYVSHGGTIENLEATTVKYLPVYTAWSFIVSVILPLAFQFK